MKSATQLYASGKLSLTVLLRDAAQTSQLHVTAARRFRPGHAVGHETGTGAAAAAQALHAVVVGRADDGVELQTGRAAVTRC